MSEARRPITDLFGDLAGQFQRLIRTEYLLAKTEVGESIGKAGNAATLVLVGVVLLLPAVTILLGGLALLLTRVGLGQDLALLIVGALAAVIGMVTALSGIKKVKAIRLVPEKTLDQLQRDVHAINPTRPSHERAAA